MTELLTAAQMRAVEAAAIASGEVTGLDLMERAGRGVVEAVFDEWPELRAGSFRAVVLCGPGGNGGDGFVVARVLKEWGWEVEVFLYGEPERMPPDARVNYERWVGMGEVKILPPNFEASVTSPDVVVDALFGTGLSRPVSGLGLTFLDMGEERRSLWPGTQSGTAYVAIDVPSGICADSGRPLKDTNFKGIPFRAEAAAASVDLTVTFHSLKVGHVLDEGPHRCGRIRVCDIGLEYSGDSVQLIGPIVPYNVTKSIGHKFSHGHALILCGPPGHGGAARMTARGALRIGAGLVTLGVLPEALAENAARLDAVMLKQVPNAAALAEVLKDDRITALCLGPGMGISDETRSLLATALKSARPTFLDADALTLIARDATLFASLHDRCILTPHAGEFARLFPDIAAKLGAPATTGPAYSKVDATREAAKRAGCVVLFKGADTVIASPDGTCAINAAAYDRAAPWLATAGSGDVLAGFITGLLARRFAPQQAAETGAWLHVECARSFGPGLIAEDLAEELPKVFRALGV